MKRAAIIIAAWRAEAWIGPCLDAVRASVGGVEGWDIEIRVGVDGCGRTARALEALEERYWWTPENVGCFRMRNALIALGHADAYVEFDADDIMLPGYLPAVLQAVTPHNVVQAARFEVSAALAQTMPPTVGLISRSGIRTFSRAALETIGGHRPWRCGADSETGDRLVKAKVPLVVLEEPLYLRRRHPDSLTNAPATGMQSPARQKVRREIARLTSSADVHVRPRGVVLEERTPARGLIEQTEPFHFAVIIAAHRASRWIGACVASVRASAADCAANVRIERRIGVDACAETANTLDQLGEPYFLAAENVGAYVMRNSLVTASPADAYVMFDADDVMLPAFLPRMVRALRAKPIVGPSRIECDEHLVPRQPHRVTTYKHGVCGIRHDAWEQLGGFRAERFGADTDLIARADMRVRRHGRLFVRVERTVISEAMYLRRRHGDSLTRHPDTGFHSRSRAEAIHRMDAARAAGQWQNTPVTVSLLYVDPVAREAARRAADLSVPAPGDWRAMLEAL